MTHTRAPPPALAGLAAVAYAMCSQRRWTARRSVAEARKRGMEVVISALTIIEAAHRRTDRPRLARVLSGTRIVPVGDEDAKRASALLIAAGLHGHKYAIDAAVAEMALRQRRPVVMLTSDLDDMTKLCGEKVRLVAV